MRRDTGPDPSAASGGTAPENHEGYDRSALSRIIARWLLAIAYLAAGYLHITRPAPFLAITPRWVPFPHETVIATGICELFGAVGLLTPRARWWAGVMLALYALCVWPANMQHAINDLGSGTGLGWWYHVPRLLAQPLIVWWALYAGGVTGWPFRRADRAPANAAAQD